LSDGYDNLGIKRILNASNLESVKRRILKGFPKILVITPYVTSELKEVNMKTIKIYCANCKSLLYKYHKSGSGHLVKCFRKRIKDDYTNGDLKCPKCGQKFARERKYRGNVANKIIQGKVIVKGL
jgi:PHP family Zn ribbon phosphoesterase